MTEIPFEIVGFDLDGTLVDSAQDLAEGVNFALGQFGLPPHSLADVKRFVGKGTRILIERALRADNAYSEENMDRVLPVFLDFYADNLSVNTYPYPGALEAIEELKARGLHVAICTNKPERFTMPLLEQLGMGQLFDAVVAGDTLGPGKLKPEPALIHHMIERAGGGRCVFLGDTSNDIDAAHAAGIASIAVRFGFIDEADSLGADAILDRFDDLLPLLAAWPRQNIHN